MVLLCLLAMVAVDTPGTPPVLLTVGTHLTQVAVVTPEVALVVVATPFPLAAVAPAAVALVVSPLPPVPLSLPVTNHGG